MLFRSGNWYGMFVHESMYEEPVMRDIEQFLASSQSTVSGKVIMKLYPYRYELVGIESNHDLMGGTMAQYGERNGAWTADDVKGFTKMMAMPIAIYKQVNEKA